jgi:hypothetical protein
MNTVDPRFLGLQAPTEYENGPRDLVWYVRTSSGQPDADGVSDASVRLVDDPSGKVLTEMPLAVSSDYRPGRRLLDLGQGGRSDFGSSLYPRAQVELNGIAIHVDSAGYSSSPVQLAAATYSLNGFVGNEDGNQVGDQTCTTPITVDGLANVAYAVTFTKTGCSWALTQDTF